LLFFAQFVLKSGEPAEMGDRIPVIAEMETALGLWLKKIHSDAIVPPTRVPRRLTTGRLINSLTVIG
jgi:hypothetical protein